ncbi:MAG: tyrosine-type recombinase/integrase [Cellvibrionaceae bacterium]|nr:tyrosine-type recombinase/integrase [Cellvibrionaceae bacterium]
MGRTRIETPKVQMTHILRHIFAGIFFMSGGNILTLQRVLGHSDLKVTMRYAHLAPDYMMQVVDLGLGYACI